MLINIKYLAISLPSLILKKDIWSGVKQNAQPCLYLSVSNNILIPVSPLLEQDRIVTKVDDLMALCDSIKQYIVEAGELQRNLAT
jgi:type I restriction enzyme S subunit